MKKILGHLRKACNEYDMINDGDVIAVGVSGGKDSLVLLRALAEYRRFSGQHFEIKALTVDMRFDGRDSDLSAVKSFCGSVGAVHHTISTDIAQIVFDIRKEKNPCSLCARMRRGAIVNSAVELGCNKVALAHHMDDAVETFFMNLFSEGRIGCFSPVTVYPDRAVALIRPLVLAEEREIVSVCRRYGIEPLRSLCPADRNTAREDMKRWIAEREKQDKGFKERVFGAIRRNGMDGWQVRGSSQ